VIRTDKRTDELIKMTVFKAKWAILTVLAPKWGKQDFLEKSEICHFRTLIMLQLCARNQNKPMNGF